MSDWLSGIEKHPSRNDIKRLARALRELASALSDVTWHPDPPMRDCLCRYCRTLRSMSDDAKAICVASNDES